MLKTPCVEPQIDGIAAGNVVLFPDRLNPEADEDLHGVLSSLLANEFEKSKGRPLL